MLLLRRGLVLLLLWLRLPLLLLRCSLAWLLLGLCWPLLRRLDLSLLLWFRLTLLRSGLTWLLLRLRLSLLLWFCLPLLRGSLVLLLLFWRGLVLLLRCRLTLFCFFRSLLCRSVTIRRVLHRHILAHLVLVHRMHLVLFWHRMGWFVGTRRLSRIRMSLGIIALLSRRRVVGLNFRRDPDVTIRSEGLADRKGRRAAMVYVRELRPVGAGNVFILHLRPHRSGVHLMHRGQFRWSRTHLHSARSAVEAHTRAAATAVADRAVVVVVHDRDVDIVDRAVVIEVPAAPIAALVAEADVAKAVIDAAIVADMRTPVTPIKSIMVMRVAPVAGGPERALVGSFNPHAGNPIVAHRGIAPIAGSPKIIVAGSLRLVIVGQRRWRLIGCLYRLLAVARIVGFLSRPLIIRSARIGGRALLGCICGLHRTGAL